MPPASQSKDEGDAAQLGRRSPAGDDLLKTTAKGFAAKLNGTLGGPTKVDEERLFTVKVRQVSAWRRFSAR
jgi:hypothetical protein